MKRFWTAFAVATVAILVTAGCNDYGNTFQGNTGAFLNFVSPSNVTAGGPDLTITLSGAGFVTQTYATFDEKKIVTNVSSDSAGNILSVTAVIPAAMTAKVGTHFVQTVNPHSGTGTNGLSNPVAFIVNPPPNPIPSITSIAPNTAVAGSPGIALTITGTNFLSDPGNASTVRWNTATQINLTTSSVTATQIQATIPAAQLAAAGTAIVTVNNPPAPPPQGCTVNCTGFGGGGTSNGATFTITATGSNAIKSQAASVAEETPALSSDGRYVTYTASQNGHSQIFARDTCLGADASCQPRTILVSSALDGSAPESDSHAPSMSSDGRYVAFSSAAENLTSDATVPAGRQIYLRDTCFGAAASCAPSTQLISTDPAGALGGTESILPSVSSSGRFVAFLAVAPSHAKVTADKSAAPDANSGFRQIFVRDTCLGATNCKPSTTRLSLQPGDDSNGAAKPAGPALSGNASNLALANGKTATLFTRSVAVDDGVFLALTKSPR